MGSNKNTLQVNEIFNRLMNNEGYTSDKLGSKITIFFSYNQILDYDFFKDRIYKHISTGINSMLLAKVRYKKSLYLTLNIQERLYLEDYKSDTELSSLQDFILNKIQLYSLECDFN